MPYRRNLAAFTDAGNCYPPFISINESADGCTVEIFVRSAATADGRCGAEAAIAMPRSQFEILLHDVANSRVR